MTAVRRDRANWQKWLNLNKNKPKKESQSHRNQALRVRKKGTNGGVKG